MGIRGLLAEVASTYDRTAGSGQEVEGQRVLRGVIRRTDLLLPSGFKAKGHGGQTTPAATPWIGIFEDQGMQDPKRGLYLAYIFSADLKNVALTLQQGITWLEDSLGKGRAREEHLRHHARRLRRALDRKEALGWVDEPDLRDGATRPKAYEAASVIAKSYDIAALPSEIKLLEDLDRGIQFLRTAERFDRVWWASGEGDVLQMAYAVKEHVSQLKVSPRDLDPLADFQPKESGDYTAQIKARQQVKQRSHEDLINDFGLHVANQGFAPVTKRQHPKDLVLRRMDVVEAGRREWLVEAKVVRNGNSTVAVREAIGQLYEYRHFLYRGKPAPFLVGLFSEDIGVYASYLETHGIASVWRSGQGWEGSPQAREWGLTTE